MPDSKTDTWDDLYHETNAPEPTNTPEVVLPPAQEDTIPGEPERPIATSDAELEALAQVPKKDDEPEVPPAPEPDVPEPKPADEPEEGADPPAADDDVKMTGIEQYLSQFDIDGGMINFDDGSSTHFSELEPDKQAEVLSRLHDTAATSVEEKYGLDGNEVGLINYLRENKLTVQEMVEGMAEERVNVMLAMRDIETVNYDEMNADAVYVQFLKRSNPEATAEQLESDLEKAKQQSNFDKVSDSLRAQFKTEQDFKLKSKLESDNVEQTKIIEQQRQQVVDSVSTIQDISGIKLDDSMRNGVLDRVLEVNEYGDSMFMEEVFSDPKRLFQAAFWYYNGSDVLVQRDNYWKQEKSKAYKRGRQEALGQDPTKISFTTPGSNPQPSPNAPAAESDDWRDLHG